MITRPPRSQRHVNAASRRGAAAAALAAVLALACCAGGDDPAPETSSVAQPDGDAVEPTTSETPAGGGGADGQAPEHTDVVEPTPSPPSSIPAPEYSSFAGDLAMLDARDRFPKLGRQIDVDEMRRALLDACHVTIETFAAGGSPTAAVERIVSSIYAAKDTNAVAPLVLHGVATYFKARGCPITEHFNSAVTARLEDT